MEGWKRGRLQSHEETQRQPKNTVSSVGSASVCLSVTLICKRNQMKEWKAAYRSQKHVTLSQPQLSVCGCSRMVMPLPRRFAGKTENTSCGAIAKLVSVSNKHYVTFHTNPDPVRQNLINKFSSSQSRNNISFKLVEKLQMDQDQKLRTRQL